MSTKESWGCGDCSLSFDEEWQYNAHLAATYHDRPEHTKPYTQRDISDFLHKTFIGEMDKMVERSRMLTTICTLDEIVNLTDAYLRGEGDVDHKRAVLEGKIARWKRWSRSGL